MIARREPITRYPGIISHRGICRTAPIEPRRGENTIEALVEGIQALAAIGLPKVVEFDVREAKDGALVLMHDRSLDRTTNGRGLIDDWTFADLSKLDAGFGRRIPLLADVLDTLGQTSDVQFCIEIKQRGLIARVKEMVRQRCLEERVIVSAFQSDEDELQPAAHAAPSGWDELAALAPNVRFALLATKKEIDRMGAQAFVREAVDLGACAVNPEQEATTRTLVSLAHDRRLQVNVFTVNSPTIYAELAQLRVDSVFCDNPRFIADGLT